MQFRVNDSITDVFALITSKRSIVIRSIGIQIRFLICEMDRGIDEKKSKPPSIRLAKDPPGFQKNLPRILRVGGASGVGPGEARGRSNTQGKNEITIPIRISRRSNCGGILKNHQILSGGNPQKKHKNRNYKKTTLRIHLRKRNHLNE